jgi:pyruvate dehydrogenase E2 component (dihydrolipoamide acetyltransferase)
MTLTLSWDHRALGGAVAAEFLADVREVLEQPYRLLVD